MHNASINYFEEIASVCGLLESSAKEFNALLGAYGASGLERAGSAAKKARDGVRSIRRSLEAALYHDFITPIEREDVISIVSAAEGVSCGIVYVLSEMRAWGITKSRGEAIEFSDAARRSLAVISRSAQNLEKFRKDHGVLKSAREASGIAKTSERLYFEAMSALIRGGANTNELLAWSRIYDRMDEMLCGCASLADAIGAAILNNI